MKKIISYTYFCLLVLIAQNLFSQEYKFIGTVKDSITNEPIYFAAVMVQNEKDSTVYYTYTNDNGSFMLSYKGVHNGKICVSMLGYKQKCSGNIDFYAMQGGYNIPIDIKLVPKVNMLEAVTISDSTTKSYHKLDRDVHIISTKQAKESSTIYDIFKTLPGVVVDEATKAIRFKGGSPDVLVNNMPAEYIYPDLKQINVDDIEKIELIDKSSIYGGSGEGGIINIKFKKDKKTSTFGMYLGANQAYNPFDNYYQPQQEMLNININLGKILIFNNFWAGTYKSKSENESNGTLQYGNDIFNRNEISKPSYSQTYITDCFGVMMNFDKINILIADQINYSTFWDKNYTNRITYLDTAYRNEITQEYRFSNDYFVNKVVAKISVQDYKNQDIEFNVAIHNSFHNRPMTNDNQIISNIFEHQNYSSTTQNFTIKSLQKTNIYQAEYKHLWRITQNSQLNFHANYLFGNIPKSENNYFENDIENLNFHELSDFHLHVLPLGIGFVQRFGRFSMDLTANYKFQQFNGHFQRNFDNGDSTLILKLPYHNFEPSIRLKYNINKSNGLYLGYSYESGDLKSNDWSKPIQFYVPYIDKSDPLYWYSGNDSLKMENYHKLYFQYRLNKEKLNFTTEVFYSHTDNEIQRVSIPISQEILLSIYENVGKRTKIGTDLSLWWKFAERWRLNASSQLYYANISSDIEKIANLYNVDVEDITQRNFGGYINFTLAYFMKAKIGTNPCIFLWCQGNLKEITVTGYNEPYFSPNLVFQTSFFKEKLYMQLMLQNLLSPWVMKNKSYYDYMGYTYNQTSTSTQSNMRIGLTVGLNLFKGERGTKDIQL